jgi:DNA polymerase alpha subunit B
MSEWEMPVQPDILIVPSKLASFARVVLDTTIVVNPGELTKNTTGGTYASIDVHPMKKEVLEEGVEKKKEEDENMDKGVQDRVRVDIRRI